MTHIFTPTILAIVAPPAPFATLALIGWMLADAWPKIRKALSCAF